MGSVPAGLVAILLILNTIGLPTKDVPLLITVDWLLLVQSHLFNYIKFKKLKSKIFLVKILRYKFCDWMIIVLQFNSKSEPFVIKIDGRNNSE